MVDPIAIFLFVLGALFGSFANVVIYRWPKGESVIRPGSHCGSCQKPVAWYDNVPIFAWLYLRGRCRQCGAAYSIRYPLVELLMAVAFTALYLKIGHQWILLEYLIFAFGLITASFIDLDHMLLPDVFTLSGIGLGLLGALLNPERSFWPSLWGVLLGGGALWAVASIYAALRKQEGMGGGDIKLLAWIGAVLGWTSVPFVIISSSLIGSLIGLTVVAVKKKGLDYAIPFGPFLAIGAILYIFVGHAAAQMYLRFFIPSLDSLN